MNQEQIKAAVRWLLGLAGGFLVGKGWVKADQVTALLSNEAVIGGLGAAGVLVWGMLTHTQANAVAVVDTIAKDPASPVKGVVMANTEEGRELAAELPGATTVVAGTADAAAVAKTGAAS